MNPNNSFEQNTLTQEVQKLDFLFENQITPQTKCTDQGSSGRCWLFAGLNLIRTSIIRHLDLPMDFELSQNYLFFWDKYERSKYFLETYPLTQHDDRLREFFLRRPIVDGGQWNMFVNLVNKYGVVPKSNYNDTINSRNSSRLNNILNNKLKDAILRNRPTDTVLNEIYTILVSFLGRPPLTFTWRYESNKQVRVIKDITPLQLYRMIPFDVNEYISIINDPRNEYSSWYTVDYLNNMVHTPGPEYLNEPMETLTEISKSCINNNTPVWFGSDVMPFTSRELCISGLNYFDYPVCLTKKEQLETFDSAMTHAMVLHGYDFNNPVGKWKIENSWSTKGPYNGYYIADHKWFERYVYQITVPKNMVKKIPPKKLKHLAPWDPFGSLARKKIITKCKCLR